MATLLKIKSSLFGNSGQSSILTEQFSRQWQTVNPDGHIISRNLATDPVPHLDQERFQAFIAKPEERNLKQKQLVAYSDNLIEEIKSADSIVMGVPMYNFSVPSVLRAYFDQIARAGITFRYTSEGPEGLLKDKKAYIFITRGGVYGEEHEQTRFLKGFLGFLGITDVELIHVEGLAMDAKEDNLEIARGRIGELLNNRMAA